MTVRSIQIQTKTINRDTGSINEEYTMISPLQRENQYILCAERVHVFLADVQMFSRQLHKQDEPASRLPGIATP